MIIMELPEYLTSLGGAEYKGLIIALFTLTAGLSRPFSGKLTDKIGRMPVMIFGALVSSVCLILYPLISGLAGFFFLRLLHGLSTGFKPTATSAYVADIVPANKRGEAMGILGLFGSTGMALGPVLGSYIAGNYSYDAMFYCASFLALLSVLILFRMKETLVNKERFSTSHLKVGIGDVYEKAVVPAGIVMCLGIYGFGVVLTIIPDFVLQFNVENKSIFLFYMTFASVLVRFFAGKASDTYGRIPVLKIGFLFMTVATIYIGISETIAELYSSAFILGIGVGMVSPTIFAWAIDLCPDDVRGRGMATLYIALEIGIGSGALISSLIYANNSSMFRYTFWSSALLSILAIIYLYYYENKLKKSLA